EARARGRALRERALPRDEALEERGRLGAPADRAEVGAHALGLGRTEEVDEVDPQDDGLPRVLARVRHDRAALLEARRRVVDVELGEDAAEDLPLELLQLGLGSRDRPRAARSLGEREGAIGDGRRLELVDRNAETARELGDGVSA